MWTALSLPSWSLKYKASGPIITAKACPTGCGFSRPGLLNNGSIKEHPDQINQMIFSARLTRLFSSTSHHGLHAALLGKLVCVVSTC